MKIIIHGGFFSESDQSQEVKIAKQNSLLRAVHGLLLIRLVPIVDPAVAATIARMLVGRDVHVVPVPLSLAATDPRIDAVQENSAR